MGMPLLAMLVLSAVYNLAISLQYQYHFVSTPKSWNGARRYCKAKYTGLATINNVQDMEEMASLSGKENGFVGLRKRWGWSQSYTDDYREGERDYRNWTSGPKTHDCGSIEEDGGWISTSCSSSLTFFCYNGSATDIAERFTFVNISMNWADAQAHCKNLSTELAIVRNQLENEELQKAVKGGPAWIGLSRTHWEWIDGSTPSFIPWATGTPLLNEDCAYLHAQHKTVKSRLCYEEMAFFCFSVPWKKEVVKLKLSTDDFSVDMNDPAVMNSVVKLVTEQLKERGLTKDVKVSGLKLAEEDKPKEPEQHLTYTEKECIP